MSLAATTPNQIQYFILASAKARVKLESKGLKSRGGSIRKLMATRLGLKSTTKYEDVIEAIQLRMEELLVVLSQESQQKALDISSN